MNVEIGTERPVIPRKGKYKWDFLCSVGAACLVLNVLGHRLWRSSFRRVRIICGTIALFGNNRTVAVMAPVLYWLAHGINIWIITKMKKVLPWLKRECGSGQIFKSDTCSCQCRDVDAAKICKDSGTFSYSKSCQCRDVEAVKTCKDSGILSYSKSCQCRDVEAAKICKDSGTF